jgi:hypothetical protein
MASKLLNGAMWIGLGTSIGMGLSIVLNPDQVNQVAGIGDQAAAFVSVAGLAISAFLMALRGRQNKA